VKVGDIVRQHGKTIKSVKEDYNKNLNSRFGIVLEIKDVPDNAPDAMKRNMKALTGRLITVMWDSGVIHKNFAEKMLEVVIEPD
jgi:hypothetical protein